MKPLHFPRSARRRRFSSGAALTLLSTTALAVLGGCLTDGDVGRGTTDETNTARIVGPGGSSASGAEILVFKMGDTTQTPVYVTYADQDGRYSLKDLPTGRYNLVANSGTFALYRDSVALGPNASRVDTLARPGSLYGRVELESGDDPKAVTVQALGTDLWSNVDSMGRFSFAKIPGGGYTLRASTDLRNYTPTFARVEAVDDSAVVMEKPIRLVYTGKEPRIFLPDGAPAAGAVVRLFPYDQSYAIEARRMVTDASGRYSLASLEAGKYHMQVQLDELALLRDTIWLAPGVVRNDTLRRTGSLEGRVEFIMHGSAGLAVLTLAGTGIGSTTGPTGAFEFHSLPAGKYTLRLTPNRPYYEEKDTVVEVVADSVVVFPDPIRPRYFGPSPVPGLQAVYDTLAGVVRLSWHGTSVPAEYHVLCDSVGASGRGSSWHRVVTDTNFVDTVFHIGGIPSAGKEWGSTPLGAVYRVCFPWPDGTVGACSSVEMHLVSPYERRRSGMRWTRIGTSPISVDDAQMAQFHVLRDSLQIVGTYQRFSAWKSADGAAWVKAFDSISTGSLGQPVSWKDSLWILVQSGDSLELRASRDGLAWTRAALPHRFIYLPDSGMGIPSLLPASAGLVVYSRYAAFPSQMRDDQGIWRATSSEMRAFNVTTAGLDYLATPSGVWGVSFSMYQASRLWNQDSVAAGAPERLVPAGTLMGQIAELDGLLYFRTYSQDGPGKLFATTVASNGSWWYVDFPGGTCQQVIPWKGRLVALGSDGGVWLGEPTSAP